MQAAEEREASGRLSSELSKARAAVQRVETEAARQKCALLFQPSSPSLIRKCSLRPETGTGITCPNLELPRTSPPACNHLASHLSADCPTKRSGCDCRQAAQQASAELLAAQQAAERAQESLALQKSALGAMEADYDVRTRRLQAALQEAAEAQSSVDALRAEVAEAAGKAQAAEEVTSSFPWLALTSTSCFCCSRMRHPDSQA